MASRIHFERQVALVIGINKYLHEPLKYCINDAMDINSALIDINFCVLYVENCNYITFKEKIKSFANKIQPNDLVLFYFAGHGKQNENENYLLPSDYDYDYGGLERDYIVEHGINVEYIRHQIDHRNARVTIYLFDCCRNLIRTRSMNAIQGLLPVTSTASRSLVVFACAPGSAVQDETRNNRNGSFVENLLKYITRPELDFEEIIQLVTRDVKVQTNNFQEPHRMSNLDGKIFLTKHKYTGWYIFLSSSNNSFILKTEKGYE